MDLGPHAAFIWGSYAVVAIVLGALILWLWLDGAAQKSRLDELERKGLGRGARAGRSEARDARAP